MDQVFKSPKIQDSLKSKEVNKNKYKSKYDNITQKTGWKFNKSNS